MRSTESQVMIYSRPTFASQQKVKVRPFSPVPQLPYSVTSASHSTPNLSSHTQVADSFRGDIVATLQRKPFDQHVLSSLPIFDADETSNPVAKKKKHTQHSPANSENSNRSSFMRDSLPQQPTRKERYYSHALTDEDKRALAGGEKNHNLNQWTPKDLVNQHEARNKLAPRRTEKVDNADMVAYSEHDQQSNLRGFSKVSDKVRRLFKKPRIKITADDRKAEKPAYSQLQHGSQSMYDLRYSSAPAPQLPNAPLSSPFSFEEPTSERASAHIRAASHQDYFMCRPYPLRPTDAQRELSSEQSSSASSRVRSPLANEVHQFEHNPAVTFDSFLAPHKSGKGEAYHDAENAKKAKSSRSSQAGSPRPFRRLSKMPSMPSLPKRSAKQEAKEGQ